MTNSTTLWKWFNAVEEGNWAKQFVESGLQKLKNSTQTFKQKVMSAPSNIE
ncbi:MAG: hypothetical protein AAFO04_16275 [Cyanobacteria bacterium J06592_8]